MTPDEVVDTLLAAPFFVHCDRAHVQRIVADGELVVMSAGERLWDAGAADAFFLLVDGELEVTRTIGGEETSLLVTGQPGAWGGAVPGVPEADTVSGRMVTDGVVLRLDGGTMERVLIEGVPVTMPLLRGLNRGVKEAEARTRERERLVSLGKLAAELNHELNNPAAAAARAVTQVQRAVAALETAVADGVAAGVSAEAVTALVAEGAAGPTDPLDRSDAEEELATVLARAGIDDPYAAAGPLVAAGVTVDRLADVGAAPAALRWLASRTQLAGALTTLEQSVSRIVELVGAVKRFSRVGRAHAREEVDLHAALDTTVTLLGHKLRGITIQREYAPELPVVHANGGELNQVWMNLLDNAADAAGEGGTITLRTHADQDHVSVEVADDGHGIRDDVLPHVFEPFFTTKEQGDGLGLGLDTVHAIVTKHHGGTIEVDSAPGDGATFRVRLPRAAPAAAAGG